MKPKFGDPDLVVPGGVLLHHPNRDIHLPQIYVVPTHPHFPDRQPGHPGRMLVMIQDQSEEVLEAQAVWEAKLEVPLGPDAEMPDLGTFANHIISKRLCSSVSIQRSNPDASW